MRTSSLLLGVCLLSAACGGDDGGESAVEYRAVLHGTLVGPGGNNAEPSRAAHDAAARGVRGQPVASDLQTHLAFTALADPTDYRSIDTWTDLDSLRAYYSDPAVTSAWAGLFQAPPTLEVFRNPSGWSQWGTVSKTGQGAPPAFFFHLRNRLGLDDEEENRLIHNRVAGGDSQAHAMALTDIAHSVNLGVDDAQELLFMDFWQDLAGAEEFFTDPVTIAGGAELFPTPFDVTVYAPTDWYQWTEGQAESGPIDGTWSVQSLTCNDVEQPIPGLTVQIANTQGSFAIDVPDACTATISETYSYPTTSTLLITPVSNTCLPTADACAPVFGGDPSCPTPPPVEFTFALAAGELEFTRTSVGPPVDSCPAGELVRYTMLRR